VSASETHTILIGYDGSPGALRAIETAGAMFPGRKAVVLHVWSPVALIASTYGGRSRCRPTTTASCDRLMNLPSRAHVQRRRPSLLPPPKPRDDLCRAT
jgi:hypothetical protein